MVESRSDLRQAASAIARSDFVYRSATPPVFDAADGVYLVDTSGRRYLDAEAANGAAILGYDASILTDAVQRTAKLCALPSFCESAVRLELADRLVGLIESETGARGQVAFETGGAQGIELALKLARANTKGRRVVVFEGGYHGRSYQTSALSASQRYRNVAGASQLESLRLPLPDCSRCRFGRAPQTCHAECASFVQYTFSNDAAGVSSGEGDHDCCALVFEPILNVAGMVAPDPRYLQAAVRAVRGAGGLIIADEIFTGLYRTGKLFGFMGHDISPDIVVFSKGLSNGIVPISCVWAKEALFSQLGPGSHSATYINAPLGAAIALSVLERLKALPAEKTVERVSSALRAILERLRRRFSMIERVDVFGVAARIVLSVPMAAKLRAIALTAQSPELPEGLLLASTGMTPNVINLHPPMVISEAELGLFERLLIRSLEQVVG